MKSNSRTLLISTLAIMLVPSMMGMRISPPKSPETVEEVPYYQECKQSANCPNGYCCTLGMMRYQMPHCQPMGHLADPCHPYGDNYRKNFTLNFPTTEVHIQEAWLVMCPCEKDFHCSMKTATCKKVNNENLGGVGGL